MTWKSPCNWKWEMGAHKAQLLLYLASSFLGFRSFPGCPFPFAILLGVLPDVRRLPSLRSLRQRHHVPAKFTDDRAYTQRRHIPNKAPVNHCNSKAANQLEFRNSRRRTYSLNGRRRLSRFTLAPSLTFASVSSAARTLSLRFHNLGRNGTIGLKILLCLQQLKLCKPNSNDPFPAANRNRTAMSISAT